MSELHDFCRHYDRCVCSPQKPTYQQLEAELKAAREEIVRLSGKTGFCIQCAQYAKERDSLADELKACHENHIEVIRERDRLLEIKEDYEILVDECVKYREALKDIEVVLGPLPIAKHKPHCLGCLFEMNEALRIAKAALQEEKR